MSELTDPFEADIDYQRTTLIEHYGIDTCALLGLIEAHDEREDGPGTWAVQVAQQILRTLDEPAADAVMVIRACLMSLIEVEAERLARATFVQRVAG